MNKDDNSVIVCDAIFTKKYQALLGAFVKFNDTNEFKDKLNELIQELKKYAEDKNIQPALWISALSSIIIDECSSKEHRTFFTAVDAVIRNTNDVMVG